MRARVRRYFEGEIAFEPLTGIRRQSFMSGPAGEIPYLIFIWAAMLLLAVLRSRSLTHSKWLLTVSWWIGNAVWLSIGMFAMAAYSRSRISGVLLLAMLAGTYPVTAGSYWLIEKRCPNTKKAS